VDEPFIAPRPPHVEEQVRSGIVHEHAEAARGHEERHRKPAGPDRTGMFADMFAVNGSKSGFIGLVW